MERKLTLEDVQGMFLLLGAGFGIASFSLTVEILAWLLKYIRAKFCSNQTDGGENMSKPPEGHGSCDFAPSDSQRRIFLNEIGLKRRAVSENVSSVVKTPRIPKGYRNVDKQCPSSLADVPVSDDSEAVGTLPISLHMRRSETWGEDFDNRNYLVDDDYFGDVVRQQSAGSFCDYDTRSMEYLSTKEHLNVDRSFTF